MVLTIEDPARFQKALAEALALLDAWPQFLQEVSR